MTNPLTVPERTTQILCRILSLHFSADKSIEECDVASLPPDTLRTIEADSFWCFSKLLDSIQDNYTFAQPGIQLKVNALKDIISRVDSECGTVIGELWLQHVRRRRVTWHCTLEKGC